ncbi:MAG: TAXI family TRAP transporter solute-binding subunit [Hyphomicrobiaceae bacterium]
MSKPCVSRTALAVLLCAGLLVFAGVSPDAQAQTAPKAPRLGPLEQMRAQINENVVTIISGNPNGGYLGIAYDIAAVTDDGDNLRVLPIVGKGAVQNVRDILFLRGIDMGLVNTVTLSHFKEDPQLGQFVTRNMVYITRLFEDELHILVRPGIRTFKDLEGKRVNFSDKGSGAQLAAQRMFAAHSMNVVEVNMGQADAIERMKRGEVDATLCTCLKPLRPYAAVPKELGFRLLHIPYEGHFQADYLPAELTHADYPNLIPEGEKVETVAVPTMLMAFNWPGDHARHQRLARFVDAFFTKFPEIQKPPRHPRWKNVNLAATMDGWPRFAPAQEWLDRVAAGRGPTATAGSGLPAAGPNSAAINEALFKEFLEWRRRRGN